MRPLTQLPASVAAGCVLVLTDIDDTLTHEGRLPARAYAALEDLAEAGLPVVPITGRPAGWCDLIARLWPVAGVVGENGAFYFAYDRARRVMRRRYLQPEGERQAHRARLAILAQEIMREVPGAALSADQAYRETDLAVDFCEDVPPLEENNVVRIVALFEAAGATAKVSSIHVNGWFGRYDKLGMTRVLAREVLGLDLDAERERVMYCGDSPNDAPMVAFVPHACGVANVRDFAGRLSAEPAYIAEGRGGEGFAEIAAHLLTSRASGSGAVSEKLF